MPNGKTITTPHSLKNEFRDEVKKEGKSPLDIETEKVGDAEMLRRDQFVSMRQLQVQRDMHAKDIIYTENAINEYAKFVDELLGLTLSHGREAVLDLIHKQVDALAKGLQQTKLPRSNEVTLAVLEEKFAAEDEVKDAIHTAELSAEETNKDVVTVPPEDDEKGVCKAVRTASDSDDGPEELRDE